MLETFNNFCLVLMDPVLGWLLYMPRDLAIIIVSVATSALLTFTRPFCTNQDLLARCNADKKRLKDLAKKAKAEGDKDALLRYRATNAQIAMKLMKAEGKPLLIAIIPIALLATWCFGRLAYHPPAPGETVTVNAFFPAAAIGHTAHMLPQPGLKAEQWIARVEETPNPIPDQEGTAVWKVKGEKNDKPHDLDIRYQGRTYPMELLVGHNIYAPNIKFFNAPEDRITVGEVALKPFRLFGIVHIPWGQVDLFFPPWMQAYLLIAIPFVFLLKGIFHIH